MTSSSERMAAPAQAGSHPLGNAGASAGGAPRRPTPQERLHGVGAGAAPVSGGGAGPGPAPGAAAGSPHARFIPREELGAFAAWNPGSFGGAATPRGVSPAPTAEAAPSEAVQAQLQAARQAGYQDGYRDGLVALEAFKQSYAQQMTAQVTALVTGLRAQLEQLEHGLAGQVAEVAIALARQVVRTELSTQPAVVAAVAQEALGAVLVSAQQLALRLHPDDHALVRQHAGEALAERGARLLSDASLTRGGCVVETDVGVIDASVEARWRRATAAMGRPSDYGAATGGEGA